MRLILASFTAVGLVVAAPAAAQSVGMQIVDTAGGVVGTVTAVKGDNLQIKTDKHEALLPRASFTPANGKLLFGMTQGQLDAQIDAGLAASQKSIVAGAAVTGSGGDSVGKIETVDSGSATITLTSGKRIQVPTTGLRGNADGTVTIGYTANQIEAMVNSSSDSSSSAGGSSGK